MDINMDAVLTVVFEILSNPIVDLAVVSASAMGIFMTLFMMNDDNQGRGRVATLLLLIALLIFALFGIVRP